MKLNYKLILKDKKKDKVLNSFGNSLFYYRGNKILNQNLFNKNAVIYL